MFFYEIYSIRSLCNIYNFTENVIGIAEKPISKEDQYAILIYYRKIVWIARYYYKIFKKILDFV